MGDVGNGHVPDGPHAFHGLLPEAMRDRVTVLPAERIALHVLDLPIRSARQRREAIPFALEESVGRPLDRLHFAICESFPDGRLLVAVVDREAMDTHIVGAPDRPLIAEQMLLPIPEPGNAGQPTWRSHCQDGRVLVRASDGTGFAARADMFPRLWQAAGKPDVFAQGDPLPDAIPGLPDGSAPPVTAPDRFDLRQGAYRTSRGLERPLRWLAASVVLAILAHLGLVAADVRAQRAIAASLQTAAASALAARLPNASVEADPALLLRQMSMAAAPQGGSDFLPLMQDVSQAWLRDGAAVQLRQLSWSDEALRLVVEAPDLETLQRAEASLAAGNLQVSSGSATADAGSARAELTVRP